MIHGEAASALEALGGYGYLPAAEGSIRFPVERPRRETLPMTAEDGTKVAVKLYPSGRGETAFRNMSALWRSSFGAGREPPGLPRPIEYLSDIGTGQAALVMEGIEGRKLLDVGNLKEHPLEAAMRLAADLHVCGVEAPRLRTEKKLVRSIERKAERVRELAPRLGPSLAAVARALESRRERDTELVPCHGDFSPRNVLVAHSRHVLIDWDRFQLAAPERDVAYFGAWCWVRGLRSGSGDWSALERSVEAYRTLRPEADLASRLGFHVAAALARIASDIVELAPAEADLVPRIAAEALRRMGCESRS